MPHPNALEAKNGYIRHLVLDRLKETGGDMRAACRTPGMPTEASVLNWRRADPDYDAQVREAMQRGKMARWRAFDEAKAAEIVRRLRDGEALRAICADPAMPCQRTVTTWRRTQIFFGEDVLLAIRRRRAAIQAAVHPPRQDYDPAVAEKVLLAVAKGTPVKRLTSVGLPGKRVIARWRAAQPWFDGELRALAKMGPRVRSLLWERRVAPEIARRVGEGASLRAVGAEAGMPHARTLNNWSRRGGTLVPALSEACDRRDDDIADEIVDIAAGPGELAEKQRRMRELYGRMARGRAGTARLPKGPRPAFLGPELDDA